MTSDVRRKFRSSPYRDAQQTWIAIIELLTQGKQTGSKRELEAVTGIASSCITDQATKTAPIIVTCDGRRTRIYCLYDDDALEGSDANENVIGFDPLNGDWSLSLPCEVHDLQWVQAALKKYSLRITARHLTTGVSDEAEKKSDDTELTIDLDGFLGS